MSYADIIKEHLANYKQKKFPNIGDGVYKGNGKTYPHILPENKKELNLLEKYRDDFNPSDYPNFEFHRDFHHLNSSQAMCINFFYPLAKEKKLEFILEQLGLGHERAKDTPVEFERLSYIDKATKIDFYFETESGKKLYFEIKYTEEAFAKAEHDYEHKDKYEKVYKEAADGIISKNKNTEECFLGKYQIMRNLIHLSEDSYVIFVVPKNNTKVYTQAEEAKEFVIAHKDNVKVLTWESLCGDDFSEFKEKYKF